MIHTGVREPVLLGDILLQSADPFFFLDSQGRIQVWNRGAELLFGWTADEVLGRNVDMLIPESQSINLEVDELWEQVHDAVVVQNYEGTFKNKQNEQIPVKMTITLIRDARGNIVGSSVNVRDITREKALQNQLHWRIGEMSLLDDVMVAIQQTLDLQRILRVVLTAVTAGSGIGFNRAFLFLTSGDRLEPQLAIGCSSWQEAGLVWPRVAKLPNLVSVIEFVLNEPETAPTEAQRVLQNWNISLDDTDNLIVRTVRENRSFVWPGDDHGVEDIVERLRSPAFAVVPMTHAGEAIGAVVADNAVTKRPIDEHAVRLLRLLMGNASAAVANARLYQRILQHVRNLEAANQQIQAQQNLIIRTHHMATLGQIVAAISHEVKGPLVPIGGFARIMRRDVPDDSEQAEMLDIIIKEVDRLERVVKGVIALATMPLPSLEPVSFADLTENVYAVFRDEASARGILLETDVPSDMPQPHLDVEQWHQVLLNLVSNALAATPNGGRITLSVRLLDDGWYRIAVKDTGVGVAEENIPKVFGPLYSTKPTGSGMGLNIVAQIVERHYGRITVRSAVGEGTTIRIDVPPPDRLRSLIAEERRAAEGEEDIQNLDPLTVATFKPGNSTGM